MYLFCQLENMFVLSGYVLEWFSSYLKEVSNVLSLSCGVPQGSVLDPLIFTTCHVLCVSLEGCFELAITSMQMTHICTCHFVLAMKRKFPYL